VGHEAGHGLDLGLALLVVFSSLLAALLAPEVVAVAFVVQRGHPVEYVFLENADSAVDLVSIVFLVVVIPVSPVGTGGVVRRNLTPGLGGARSAHADGIAPAWRKAISPAL